MLVQLINGFVFATGCCVGVFTSMGVYGLMFLKNSKSQKEQNEQSLELLRERNEIDRDIFTALNRIANEINVNGK
jgi:hypothetical protein